MKNNTIRIAALAIIVMAATVGRGSATPAGLIGRADVRVSAFGRDISNPSGLYDGLPSLRNSVVPSKRRRLRDEYGLTYVKGDGYRLSYAFSAKSFKSQICMSYSKTKVVKVSMLINLPVRLPVGV